MPFQGKVTILSEEAAEFLEEVGEEESRSMKLFGRDRQWQIAQQDEEAWLGLVYEASIAGR